MTLDGTDPAALPDLAALADDLCTMAVAAGGVILEIYRTDFEVRRKADASPVSEADERAEQLIVEALSARVPGIPIVAEELAAAGRSPDVAGRPFFLVDPLDGTKEFVARRGEFTVNIALVSDGVPVLGVVHVPVTGDTYWSDGAAAWRRRGDGPAQAIACREPPGDGLVVIASRSHRGPETEAYLAQLKIREILAAGSSVKFCRVAEGAADLYPRFGPTCEWDTAAGHAVLAAAGGSVAAVTGGPLAYGKPGFLNPGFIARGRG